jgi:endonuclease/exonuclease/phosphatase family metal-dependent hydrolase
MDTAAPLPPPPPPQWLTLQLASRNLLNLALPGHVFYEGQEPYDTAEHDRKLAWLAGLLARLNAEVCGFQEVWHEAALKAAVARSGQHFSTVVAPGAEQGAVGTPRVGLASKLPLLAIESITDFDTADHVVVPEIGPHTRFERALLHAELRLKTGATLHVLVCHLKSKRPKYLQDGQGRPLEDRDDPLVTARATLRSLLMRAAEAAALRRVVVGITSRHGGNAPLVLLGDLNDGPHAVTTQMIAAAQAVAYDKGARTG